MKMEVGLYLDGVAGDAAASWLEFGLEERPNCLARCVANCTARRKAFFLQLRMALWNMLKPLS